MLTKQDKSHREQVEIISLDALVPKDHLVRKIDATIDFDFIYERVEDMYSDEVGRPSIDPVVLFKIVFIQYIFGIRSMRQTIKEIETNIAYRWFLGFGLSDKVPHFTTFGKNYARRFEGSKIFEHIFNQILKQAIESGCVKAEEVFIDGTHVKASANKNKRIKVLIKEEGRLYTSLLEDEINAIREEEGLKPLKKKEKIQQKTINKSPVDPDCGLFYKSEHERMFCYNVNTACDRHGFVLGVHVSAGNVHDSRNFVPLFNQVKSIFPQMNTAIADAGYITPHIAKHCFENDVTPILPYKRPMTKKGFFKKYEYVYDEYYDEYICPNNHILKYRRTDRNGYRIYSSNPQVCKECKYLSQCTQSKQCQKTITRHIWSKYLEEANHIRHTPKGKSLYSKRSQTIERVFADFKEKHGMRYTNYRGKEKVLNEAMLAFACMNMKKLANWKWKTA